MARWLRNGLFALVGVFAFVAVAATSALAHAQLDVGRAAIRDLLVEMLNARMAGRATLGAVSSMWPGPVVLRDVAVHDPRGRLALRLDRVEVSIRPLAFVRGGDVVAHRARVEGGEARLVETPSGKLTIELAFEPAEVRDGRVVSIEKIHFEGVRAVIDAEDVPVVVLEDVEGFADFERTPDQRVRLRLDRVTGTWVKPKPPGADIDIRRIEGWLDSKGEQTFEVSTLGDVNENRFALELRYFPDRSPGMTMHYQAIDRSLATGLAAIGLDVLEGLSDKVETITDMPERPGEPRREERRERRDERREERRGG